MDKIMIEFPPLLTNPKPVYMKDGKYKVHEQSYLHIPAGTLVEIYANTNKNDPTSDVEMVPVRLTKSLSVLNAGGEVFAEEV